MANDLAQKLGGSLLVTTSARTPDATAAAMEAELTVPREFYRWGPNTADNPYFGFLSLADQMVVTGDSVSMMAEACTVGCPVYLFDTGVGEAAMHEANRALEGQAYAFLSKAHVRALIYRIGMRIGPTRWTRDITIVQQRLIDTGRAGWLGEGPAPEAPPPLEDMNRAVERVQALFA